MPALPGSGKLDDLSSTDVERALRVNLEAPMLMANALLPGMLERGEGHFVMVGSLSGLAPTARQSVYNGTKFGLRGFTLALREDLRGTGVSASLVAPGFVRDAGMFADSGAQTPTGMGTATPEQVSAAVVEAIEKDRGEAICCAVPPGSGGEVRGPPSGVGRPRSRTRLRSRRATRSPAARPTSGSYSPIAIDWFQVPLSKNSRSGAAAAP